MKKITALLAGAMLLLATGSALANQLPITGWGPTTTIETFLDTAYFPGGETFINSMDFRSSSWNFTAIGFESGNYNVVKETPSTPFSATLSPPVAFTTQNTSNWGKWDSVNFSTDNLYFEDSDGGFNIKFNPYAFSTNPNGFKVYQLGSDSALLDYLANPITLKQGTYIIGFNDNARNTGGDADYDDILIALSPIPEPGTIVLLGAGLLGLGIYGRRRAKK